ncbi:hypothetical protein FS837_010233 [Tulasnella sp. UAMH 9824]|nr:hypothetical protein FS837_010233 [Tulasnella sp. UAMH 9824]
MQTVNIIVNGTKVIVRLNNPLWWLFGLGFFKIFLYITLIYPIIMWPIEKDLLGRCWKVAESSFAFVRHKHLEDSRPGEAVAQYIARVREAPPAKDLKVTSRGISKVVGQRFTDWYKINKQAFRAATHSFDPANRKTIVI